MSERLGHAIALAADVHRDQFDKAGAPYMLHAIAVMQMVRPDENAMVVGVLHDVVEDADDPVQARYRIMCIPRMTAEIVDAVDTLTHRTNEPYTDYIERVAQNYLARIVKIADLTHNMDPRRIPAGQIIDKDFQRWDKYRKALIRLERNQ